MNTAKKLTTALALCAGMTLGIGVSQARQEPGAGEKAGEKLDDAAQSIKKGLKDAGESIREQFAKVRGTVHNMGIVSRVYGRIHWDKQLSESAVEIDVVDGVATLRGTVPTLKARARAVELTQETVGVDKVIDQLAVEPPAKVTTPATPVEPAKP